ncbi:hypothetical protein GCM10018790_34520 [Kitasatospora xanthocidica]|nr:hypothetical protein GCM10018790_34520 [Kitasatospora xanthocidica]
MAGAVVAPVPHEPQQEEPSVVTSRAASVAADATVTVVSLMGVLLSSVPAPAGVSRPAASFRTYHTPLGY